jgi:hypothetical protein
VKACEFVDAGAIEQYFYDELDPGARVRLDGHLQRCATCRQHLDDLRSIRSALASRVRVDSPASGDWSAFSQRLDAAIATRPVPQRTRRMMPWLAAAAALTIAASAVLLTSRMQPEPVVETPSEHLVQASRLASPPPAAPAASAAPATVAERSLVEHSEEHFERSKLVVLGLATLDPQHARATDWQHERQLASSLLPDTRLYRLAAEKRGMTELARVLGDLETVLVETSMSERADPDALQRVQRLIARRDLVVKMNVVGSGI